MSEEANERRAEPQGPDLIRFLAHECRNAVQAVQAGLALLRNEVGEDSGAALEILDELVQPQVRLQRLIRDLEDYAAPLSVRPADCDLRDIWRRAWMQVETVGAHRPALREEAGAVELRLRTDPALLEGAFLRVFRDLLGGPADGLETSIACSADLISGRPMVRVAVRRRGGSPAEPTPQPPNANRHRRSAALAMAIAGRAVRALGGELGVDWQEGCREVSILLPGAAHAQDR